MQIPGQYSVQINKLIASAPLELYLTNGEPITVIKDIVMKGTGKIRANNNEYQIENVIYE